MDPAKPVDIDAYATFVEISKQFMALHPEIKAVGVTFVSNVIDKDKLSTIIMGNHGPLVTPNDWILAAKRFVEAAEFCTENYQGLLMGLDEMANNYAKTIMEQRNASK